MVYARVMARIRQTDGAFTRLALARQQAEGVNLNVVAQQVAKEGLSAIADQDWRKRRVAERTAQAKSGFAQALRSMAAVTREYATPEEKLQFATWLQSKRATAADGSELREVYLPAIQAAGLADMEASLLWELTERSGDSAHGELKDWLQLQRKRVHSRKLGQESKRLPHLFHRAREHPSGHRLRRSTAPLGIPLRSSARLTGFRT